MKESGGPCIFLLGIFTSFAEMRIKHRVGGRDLDFELDAGLFSWCYICLLICDAFSALDGYFLLERIIHIDFSKP